MKIRPFSGFAQQVRKGILTRGRGFHWTMSVDKTKQPEWLKPAGKGGEPQLKVYNSLTRSNTEFIPMDGKRVTWYSCGPTVYDASHMGHARNYVTTDINRRLLRDYFGYNVFFVQNVTDIDDKIIVRARQGYLFEQFKKNNTEVDGDLVEYINQATLDYANNTIKAGVESINQLKTWLDSVNVAEEGQKDAKFPMHVAAIKGALNAVAGENGSVPLEEMLSLSKTVLLYNLDKERGASVTDHAIFRDLSAYWEHDFDKDMESLNVLPPTVTTRVSEYVPEIVEFVQKVIDNGFAYSADDGSVYFDTVAFEKDPNHFYAKLQPWNRGQEDLIEEGEGSLSTNTQGKRSKNDFALWKASKPGEPYWESPWGNGRPGWHIECSVMASEVIGSQMDIHSGGIDLAFPHHDNELAQSEACHGCKQWVNYFMHAGHLHIEGQKMSKSLKNFITIREALERYSARQLRLAFAMQQWNNPFDFKSSLSEVKAFESLVSNFFSVVRALLREERVQKDDGKNISKKVTSAEMELYNALSETQNIVHEQLCDNLSVPQTLTTISELVQKANAYIVAKKSDVKVEVVAEVSRWITKYFGILGFRINNDGVGWLAEDGEGSGSTEEVVMPYLNVLSRFRDEVRNGAINKAPHEDFLAATDRVRSFDLLELGVSLDDRTDGQGALVKFLDSREKAELVEQRDERARRDADKAAKREAAAKLEEQKRQEKLQKAKIPPGELFKNDDFTAWDEHGIPTADKAGEPLSKSMKKKLQKQYDAQKKLHEQYLAGL